MVEGVPESFTRLVFARAVTDTVTVFASKISDAVYVFASLVISSCFYYLFWGLPRALTEALSVIMFSFVPLSFFVVCVFLWHLWVAPSALAYEAIKSFTTSERHTKGNGRLPKPLGSADEATWTLAGGIQHLFESARNSKLRVWPLEQWSQDWNTYDNLERSAHLIWTTEPAMTLRRNFLRELREFVVAFQAFANDTKDEEKKVAARAALDALGITTDKIVAILKG